MTILNEIILNETMTYEEKKTCLQYHLAEYGAGYTYHWEKNKTPQLGPLSPANVTEGDNIFIEVVETLTGFHAGSFAFTIKPLTSYQEKALRRYDPQDREQQLTYDFEWYCVEAMGTLTEAEQKQALYGQKTLTEDRMQEIVDRVFLSYGISNPPKAAIDGRIGHANGKNYAESKSHGPNAIVVKNKHTAPRTLLHECAHALLFAAGHKGCGHNSVFRKTLLEVFDDWLPGFTLSKLEADAIARGLGLEIAWDVSYL